MKQRTPLNKCKVCVGLTSLFVILNFFLKVDDLFIFLLNSVLFFCFFVLLICLNYPLFKSSFKLNLVVVVF